MSLSPVSLIGKTSVNQSPKHEHNLFSSLENKQKIEHLSDAGSKPAPDTTITIKDMKIIDEKEKGRAEKIADKIINFYLQLLEVLFPSMFKGDEND